ncbi:hypothetical protein [Carnobacterium inhibens]|uniref:Uncharacterized protein n=2 Tax=Carnobacterium inhibens TaxID=147709 RepID=U5S8X5_9LACT|nr:hypothetical protein [Carnobacterium inhibens]AGY81516.1 hypothetical protein Q783_04310 [Carnobacterium inhibens subsp. gilichinskyi]MBC9824665.1 hypothetical protein [Carnobacterium inhibens]
MSLEAIEYVKEAEERARQVEINGEKKVQEISQSIKKSIRENDQKMQQELHDYEINQQDMYRDRLAKEKQTVDQELSIEVKAMLKSVEDKQNSVVDHIVKEVSTHYGNS